MFNKMLIATAFLTASAASQASLISHYGYERDSASNIVRGGGLEWLKWDLTNGLSINSALASYSTGGWRLASAVEMVSLYNSFKFGRNDWISGSVQEIDTAWDDGDLFSPHAHFISLFGATGTLSCAREGAVYCPLPTDPFVESRALFGVTNGTGWYNYAQIRDDYTQITEANRLPLYYSARAYLDTRDGVPRLVNGEPGVAVSLVRTYVAVPTPGSIGLLGLGLLALGLRRRKA